MSGPVLAILWLLIASAFLWWIWTNAEPDVPAGVTITHDGPLSWNYHLDEPGGMLSTGYWTRAAAIRAANAELDRLHTKDNAQ
jgi:hypothetical protein